MQQIVGEGFVFEGVQRQPHHNVFYHNLPRLVNESYNRSFCTAAKNGRLCIMKSLVSLRDINPTIHNNLAIRRAARYGHLKVVQYLAAMEGVDVTANNNEAYAQALMNGHKEVASFLAAIPGVK
jgi:hypothetical protein